MEVLVRDIPRFYTVIAEWSACFMTICLVRKRIQGAKLYFSATVMLFVQIFFMVVTKPLEAMGDNATVAVHINRLREKIEKDPARPHYIETVWGAGYRFRG